MECLISERSNFYTYKQRYKLESKIFLNESKVELECHLKVLSCKQNTEARQIRMFLIHVFKLESKDHQQIISG